MSGGPWPGLPDCGPAQPGGRSGVLRPYASGIQLCARRTGQRRSAHRPGLCAGAGRFGGGCRGRSGDARHRARADGGAERAGSGGAGRYRRGGGSRGGRSRRSLRARRRDAGCKAGRDHPADLQSGGATRRRQRGGTTGCRCPVGRDPGARAGRGGDRVHQPRRGAYRSALPGNTTVPGELRPGVRHAAVRQCIGGDDPDRGAVEDTAGAAVQRSESGVTPCTESVGRIQLPVPAGSARR